MEAKVIRVLKKGTKLTVLQEKPGWLRVGPDSSSTVV
jgi:hypothetical protein